MTPGPFLKVRLPGTSRHPVEALGDEASPQTEPKASNRFSTSAALLVEESDFGPRRAVTRRCPCAESRILVEF